MKSISILYCKHLFMRRYLVMNYIGNVSPSIWQYMGQGWEESSFRRDQSRDPWSIDCPRDPPFSTIKEETVQAERALSHRAQGCITIAHSLDEAIYFNGIVWRLCCLFVYFLLTRFFWVNAWPSLLASFPFMSLPNCFYIMRCTKQSLILNFNGLVILCSD